MLGPGFFILREIKRANERGVKIKMGEIADRSDVCHRTVRRYVRLYVSQGYVILRRPTRGLPYTYELTKEGKEFLEW